MPIYEYISENPEDPERSCRMCRRGFELRRAADREPLTRCLYCKNPVRKRISAVNVPKLTAPVSLSDAKKAGFTVLEKLGTGEYEKL
ncbi:MAG: zinc ribbon domain-containing protein [Akkermansiaceae bacterium]|nr:zinc ribbon domain-containing protein [Akkermansiaceae bacterium]